MAISLYTVPLVLDALGKSDFGLYGLIAGVISMLSFMNASMTISTQRYLSVTMGEGNDIKLLEVYNISLILHILLAFIIAVSTELLIPWLTDYLNIDEGRLDTATLLFHFLVVNMVFTVLTVPFDAILNAYENMLAFSIFGIIESVLRLSVALLLPYVAYDCLGFYGLALTIVTFVILTSKWIYTRKKYTKLYPDKDACRNHTLFKEMFSYAGWNALAALAMVGRSQGINIVLNRFFDTVMNAAYNVANNVNGVLSYFSSTIQKSVNPQLMQSEGSKERSRLITMSYGLTKFSILSLGVIALPLIVEMPYILKLWLSEVPRYTIEFTRAIITLALIMQASTGLMSAIQSTGKIKWYTITICIILLSTIPLSHLALSVGLSPSWAIWAACITEVIAITARLLFARKLVGVFIYDYIGKTILPPMVLIILTGLLLFGITQVMPSSFIRLLIVGFSDVIIFGFLSYRYVLSEGERQVILKIVMKLCSRK